ncbi:FAD-dependent oxidoreductase [Lactobacillus sp. ESL0680]|uniref:FAD-dependent oxidoreductase n=1 Tax=Lactobacillus sp. ESL0680 TaxID=2983210 RepID=UPI0023F6D380|nr:FAD-dependent oxidoreductase [Lactobacillus sp. ESL0680]WEV37970.1 FAD-dependent oxidoreductase [Lactobacillus sp. ESL0680]
MIKDGTYQGSAQGHNANIEVTVSVKNSQISAIKVTDHQETALLSDNALKLIPEKIVANQSTAVDAITGATFTSNGILNATRAALTDAGAETTDYSTPEKITKKEHEINTDVVVLGSGLAGLNAAITAKEKGADVVLIEKTGRLGGNSVVSGGFMYATGSKFNKEQDNDPENLLQFYEDFAQKDGGEIDHDLVKTIADNSGAAVDYYADKYGVEFSAMPLGISKKPRTHINFKLGPVAIMAPLLKRIEELQIPVLYDQSSEEIKTDNQQITGVVTVGKYDDYNITCKSVVIAVGGFDGSRKTRDKYAPSAKGTRSMSTPYNDADYLKLTENLHAASEFKDGVMGIMTANYLSVGGAANSLVVLGRTLAVNNLGKRFTKEGQHYSLMYNDALKSDGNRFFWIFDKDNESYKVAANLPEAKKCTSLDDVAQVVGCDKQVIKETVSRYNSFAGKEDSDFGRDDIKPIAQEGPYYVIEGYPTTVAGFGGLKINTNAQVLDVSNKPIAGVYAAGESATGQIFVHTYPSTGTMLTTCTVFGRIAGNNAASYAKNTAL